jgi:hypothetical protein
MVGLDPAIMAQMKRTASIGVAELHTFYSEMIRSGRPNACGRQRLWRISVVECVQNNSLSSQRILSPLEAANVGGLKWLRPNAKIGR